MRPTLLNFRSPNERTPEYHDVEVTYKGEMLNFKNISPNKRTSNFSKADRFPKRGDVGEVGVKTATSFLGPGRYKHQESFNKLTQRPCSSLMRKITAIPESESKKPAYFMVGHSLKFESAFLATSKERKLLDDLNVSKDCSVSMHSMFKRRSISNLK